MHDVPTEPGIYVMIEPGLPPAMVLVERSGDTLFVFRGGLPSYSVSMMAYCRWFGPMRELGGED